MDKIIYLSYCNRGIEYESKEQMEYKGDRYYLERILNGNRDSYAIIVDRYKDNVFSLAHKVCGSFEDAEEIAQDVFVKAFRSLPKFRFDSSFSTWLYRITYNTAISYTRKRNRTILHLEDFPADSVDFIRDSASEEIAEAEYRRTLLNFAIRKLQPEDRALVSMYYFQEMELDEIESATGIGKSNIKVKLFRARKRMEETILKNQELEKMSYEKV